jgi:nitroreductase
MSTVLDNLRWRYATKMFDASKKLSDQQLDDLTEALRLSASSFGLQPYTFFVITDPALRSNIRAHAWGQTQVTDASHLIVLCARTTMDEAYIEKYVASVAAQRGVTPADLKGFRDMMAGAILPRAAEDILHWNKCQTFIALGFLLSAAAQMKIDACPMEGFDNAKVDAELGLAELGLTSCALCPVGFRAEADASANYPKARFSKEELFVLKN